MSYIDTYTVSFMSDNVNRYNGVAEHDLQLLYDQHRVNVKIRLDEFFAERCLAIVHDTGQKIFKMAMMQNRDFLQKSTEEKRAILLEIKYIKTIYEIGD